MELCGNKSNAGELPASTALGHGKMKALPCTELHPFSGGPLAQSSPPEDQRLCSLSTLSALLEGCHLD